MTRFLRRLPVRLVVAGLVAVFAALVYVQVWGLPRWAAHALIERLATPEMAVDARRVRINLLHGVLIDDVALYRKGVTGPEILAARQIQAVLDPLALLRGDWGLRGVRIIGVDIPDQPTASGRPPRESGREPGPPIAFRIELTDCTWRDVTVQSFSGDLSIGPDGWAVGDIQGVLNHGDQTGALWGDLRFSKGQNTLAGRMGMKLNPHVLLPWIDAWGMRFVGKLIRWFDFDGDAPQCTTEFSKILEPGGLLDAGARFRAVDTRYHGVLIDSGQATVGILSSNRQTRVTLDPLHMERPEGSADVAFAIDTGNRDVTFRGEGGFPPAVTCGLIGILTNGFFDTLVFGTTNHMAASGRFDFENPDRSAFTIDLKGDRLQTGKLVMQDPSMTIVRQGVTNRLEDVSATLCGGRVGGSGTLLVDRRTPSNDLYTARVTLTDIGFAELAAMLGAATKSEHTGRLNAWGTFEGAPGADVWSSIQGEGRFDLRSGTVFRLPLFGGLSKLLSRVIPGFDFVVRPSDAAAGFSLENGTVHTDDLNIEGELLSLRAEGDYHFGGQLDYHIRVALMREHTFVAKLLGAITYPISKLFEFRLRGSLEDPKWYPVNFSRDLLKRIGLDGGNEASD